ncbi:MAG: GyrI-like domain-containing protein [Vagococcus sp.]
MKTSDFSKLSNTSTRMLHHYEKMGLLNVERTITNNYRDYAPEELKKVANIKSLQALGFSLAAIKEILNAETSEEMSIYFEKQKNDLQTALEKVQSQQSLLDSIASTLADNTKHLDYHVSLKEIPERQVMSLREVVSTYEEEQTLWQKLYQEFVRQEVIFANPPLGISLYHNDSYEEQDIDIEIQSSIIGNYQDTDEVIFKTVPKMTVAATTFQGDFSQMPLVMEAIGFWLEANNLEIAGPMINIFHVTAAVDPNPDNWITEACVVVKEKELN